MSNGQPDLSIVVVNKDTQGLLRDCLTSVFDTAGNVHLEIWVVDNGSTDQSVEMVRMHFPSVNIIANTTNLGFTKANNQALAQATGHHVLLLNSDTVVLPSALQTLVQVLDDDTKVGVVGPQLLNADGSIQPSCGSFPSLWSEFLFQTFLFKVLPSSFPFGRKIHPLQKNAYQTARSVEWITGAAFAIRASVVGQVGFLDETLFMYGEDLDWCWRVKHHDYQIKFVPQAQVIHLIGASSHRDFARWIENYTRATLTFFQRHRSRQSFAAACLLIMAGCALRIGVIQVAARMLLSKRAELSQRAEGYRRAYRLAQQTLKEKYP